MGWGCLGGGGVLDCEEAPCCVCAAQRLSFHNHWRTSETNAVMRPASSCAVCCWSSYLEPEEKDQRIIDLERGGDELDGVGFRLLSWLLLVGGATIQQWPLIFFVGIASFVIVYVLGDSFISY